VRSLQGETCWEENHERERQPTYSENFKRQSGQRRDINMECIHTSASQIMPGIAMLLVESVGKQRARNDAKAQNATANLDAHGGVQNLPTARMSEVLNLNPAQRLAQTVATARKQTQ
jgi:hypothetical protein